MTLSLAVYRRCPYVCNNLKRKRGYSFVSHTNMWHNVPLRGLRDVVPLQGCVDEFVKHLAADVHRLEPHGKDGPDAISHRRQEIAGRTPQWAAFNESLSQRPAEGPLRD